MDVLVALKTVQLQLPAKHIDSFPEIKKSITFEKIPKTKLITSGSFFSDLSIYVFNCISDIDDPGIV